ncbi:unnamed protein product [Adineta steineri]|uniref:VWFA domain-containing protein n=1 Tax=Adineta steineri TaxID=433720 RepID=A0A819XKP9_9BILA|nr:unnamed protein product [Adineta steineri]CAF4142338.1 unnamed protein product [Adineta steineri]
MTTSIDITVCLDRSPSIAFYFNQIRLSRRSILNKAVSCHQSDVRMALIEFQSHSHHWRTNIYPFTSSDDEFQGWLNTIQIANGNLNDNKAIVDALDASLTLDWRPNNNINRYHEKLAILITDGAPCSLLDDACPCNSNDLWRLIHKFEEQDITLVVVGIEPSIIIYDDFYCALANKTGGEYIPLINATRILSSVIQRAILGEDTLSQLFRRLDIHFDVEYNSLYHYEYVQDRVRFMMEHCQTMADIRKWLYPPHHPSKEYIMGGMNVDDDDDFEPGSPSLETNYSFCPSINNLYFSPITNDEGYRTRLPTTASGDLSFNVISSPVSSIHIDLDSNSEIDDEYL